MLQLARPAIRGKRPNGQVTAWLMRPQPLRLLLSLSLAVGIAHALSMFPPGVILGTGAFWKFPHGVVHDSFADMANCLAGYLYFIHGSWALPLLQAPLLGSPAGTNIAFVDAAPLIALIGKLVFTLSGTSVNLLGLFAFACYVLPGFAMTLLLAEAGERRLVPILAGSVFADTAPYLLYRWGHLALCAQFLIIFALALYLRSLHRPDRRGNEVLWLALLAAAILIHPYLFVMVAPAWVAQLAQNRLDGNLSIAETAGRAMAVTGIVIAIMLLTGQLGGHLVGAGGRGYGAYTLDLLSPIMPQFSGVIPPLVQSRIGDFYQYEGFAYLGLGVLVLLLATLPTQYALLKRRARSHAVLLAVLAGFLLFAISNVIDLGWFSVEIPLPDRILTYASVFRASGRFFWPIGYALTALAVLGTLRRFKPMPAMLLLAAMAVLQLVDIAPLRAMVAGSMQGPAPAALDRAVLAQEAAPAQAILAYPSYACVDDNALKQISMEIILAGARANLPINSVYNTRPDTDCAAEAAAARLPLVAGTLYVYPAGFAPATTQFDGVTPAQACRRDGRMLYCRLPDSGGIADAGTAKTAASP